MFWVDKTGQLALVYAKEDQSTARKWHARSAGVTNAIGNDPFFGEMNTAIILSSLISVGDDDNLYAAKLCTEFEAKTYGDRYLHSSEELQFIYDANQKFMLLPAPIVEVYLQTGIIGAILKYRFQMLLM